MGRGEPVLREAIPRLGPVRSRRDPCATRSKRPLGFAEEVPSDLAPPPGPRLTPSCWSSPVGSRRSASVPHPHVDPVLVAESGSPCPRRQHQAVSSRALCEAAGKLCSSSIAWFTSAWPLSSPFIAGRSCFLRERLERSRRGGERTGVHLVVAGRWRRLALLLSARAGRGGHACAARPRFADSPLEKLIACVDIPIEPRRAAPRSWLVVWV